MKVIHFVSGFNVNYPGGITNYVKSLHSQLISLGIDSKIVCSQKELGVSEDCYIHPDAVLGVKKYNRFSFSFLNDVSLSEKEVQSFFDKEKPDVIHFHTLYGVSSAFIKNITNGNIPYVFSVHDYYLGCPRIFMLDKNEMPCREIVLDKCKSCVGLLESYNFLRIISNKFSVSLPTIKNCRLNDRDSLILSFIRNAKYILPVSSRVKEIFEKKFPAKNYKTINIGNSTADSFSRKRKEINGKINIAFLGTLNKHKGADLFINIVNKVHNELINFSFHGRADDKYKSTLNKCAIENHGPYTPSNIKNILSDVDLGMVLPIWEDNGPQVVMELLNNGVPVIGTRVGGIPDFVHHKHNGYLFHPDSINEIDNVIKWLNNLTENDVDVLMVNVGKLKTVKEHAEELCDLYRTI